MMIMVLVLLVVGGLVLAPLLGLMSTGLMAGQVYEKKAVELYAADAGIEDAVWRIQNNQLEFDSYNYSHLDLLTVSDRTVEVVVYRENIGTGCHKEFRYQILSSAAGADGSTTRVEAFLSVTDLDYADFAGNVITSGGDVTVSGQHGQVVGDILLATDGTFLPKGYEESYENGDVKRQDLIWPGADELAAFYWQDVAKAGRYESGEINLYGGTMSLPPLYRAGALNIANDSNDEATLSLNGTLYVTGDTFITGRQKGLLNIKLNGNTIFVESDSGIDSPKYALSITDKCTIEGPGAIIAVGSIYFKPNTQIGGPDKPILIFSIAGSADLQPSGDFHGSVFGYQSVYLAPNINLIYPGDGFDTLNFPGLIEGKEGYSIVSWQIK